MLAPVRCEISTIICVIGARNMSAVEIHRELYAAVYGQNLMSEGTARQWCRIFKDR
jgi:hypothetical protein